MANKKKHLTDKEVLTVLKNIRDQNLMNWLDLAKFKQRKGQLAFQDAACRAMADAWKLEDRIAEKKGESKPTKIVIEFDKPGAVEAALAGEEQAVDQGDDTAEKLEKPDGDDKGDGGDGAAENNCSSGE